MPSGRWFLAECVVSEAATKTQTRPFGLHQTGWFQRCSDLPHSEEGKPSSSTAAVQRIKQVKSKQSLPGELARMSIYIVFIRMSLSAWLMSLLLRTFFVLLNFLWYTDCALVYGLWKLIVPAAINLQALQENQGITKLIVIYPDRIVLNFMATFQ